MDKESNLELASVKLVYTQEADSCADGPDICQALEIEIADAGGGPYIVISTDRWAFDESDIDTLVQLFKDAITLVKQGQGGNHEL